MVGLDPRGKSLGWRAYHVAMASMRSMRGFWAVWLFLCCSGCIQYSHSQWDGELPDPRSDRTPALVHVHVQERFVGGDQAVQFLDLSAAFATELTATGYVRCVTGPSVPAGALALRGTYERDFEFHGPVVWPYLTLFTVGVIPCWDSYEERLQFDVVGSDGVAHSLEATSLTTTAAWLPFLVATPFFAERMVKGHYGELPRVVIGRMLEAGLLPGGP